MRALSKGECLAIVCVGWLALLMACGGDETPTGPDLITPPSPVAPIEGATVQNVCNGNEWRFEWTVVVGADLYHLQVMSPAQAVLIDAPALTGSRFSTPAPGPVWGEGVTGWSWHVRARKDGRWGPWGDTGSFNVASLRVVLLNPEDGATLDNGCLNQSDVKRWDFDWGACAGATRYHLFIKHPTARYPALDFDRFTSPHYSSVHKGYILDRYRVGWRWKVRAEIDGRWTPWTERSFDVEPVNTDCP